MRQLVFLTSISLIIYDLFEVYNNQDIAVCKKKRTVVSTLHILYTISYAYLIPEIILCKLINDIVTSSMTMSIIQ